MTAGSQPPFTAQFGEDHLLAEHFADRREGFYVEVGAYDGVTGSATSYFDQIGWQGILVEADPDLAERCRNVRPRAQTFNCAAVGPGAPPAVHFEIVEGSRGLSSLAVGRDELRAVDHIADQVRIRRTTVPAKTLDQILAEGGATEVDFMTIDVNGHEWEALQGLTLGRWRPEVVIVERLTHLPDRKMLRHMHANEYAFRRTTGVNDWYVRCTDPAALGPRYRAWLLARHYLPRYLTLYMPFVRGPVKRTVKRTLRRLSLLQAARRLARRGPRSGR